MVKTKNKNITSSNRLIYFDILRVIASFAVIMIHVSAINFDKLPIDSINWNILAFFDSVSRWAVPVFVMISGSLFLGKDIPTITIYKKYVLRIAISFVVWSGAYAIVELFKGVGPLVFVVSFINGEYHLWYLLMVTGLYIATPVLKQLVKSKQTSIYFCVICVIFSTILPTIIFATQYVHESIYSALNKSLETIGIMFGYMFYYVLGYLLSTIDFSKYKKVIYISGLLGFFLTHLLTFVASYFNGKSEEFFFGDFSPNVLAESIFVFTITKSIFENKSLKSTPSKLLSILSKCSFGIYLVHILVFDIIRLSELNWLLNTPLWAVPVFSVAIYTISFVISFILNKIPIINKFIV